MKYAGMHSNEFTFPWLSWGFAFIQLLTVLFVEIVNIMNLTYIGDVVTLVINYVAFAAINDFDSQFLEMYKKQDFLGLIDVANETNTFQITNFMKPKVRLNYTDGKMSQYEYTVMPEAAWWEWQYLVFTQEDYIVSEEHCAGFINLWQKLNLEEDEYTDYERPIQFVNELEQAKKVPIFPLFRFYVSDYVKEVKEPKRPETNQEGKEDLNSTVTNNKV